MAPDFDAFMALILEKIGQSEELLQKVKIDWSAHAYGRGIISVLDSWSIAFLKQEARSFRSPTKGRENLLFRIWSREEYGERHLLSGYLHGNIWARKKGLDVLRWIFKINGLTMHRPTLMMYNTKPAGSFIKFEATQELVAALTAQNLCLRAGICNLKLEYKKISANAAPDAANMEL